MPTTGSETNRQARLASFNPQPRPACIPNRRHSLHRETSRWIEDKAPIFLDDIVHGAARVSYISNRSLGMEYELRVGESYDTGRTVAEGSTALVFYDPDSEEVKPRPEWFLSAVADFEGRPESSFSR